MKVTKVGYIFISLGIILVLGYLVFSVVSFSEDDNNIKCNDLVVCFPENEKCRLVTKNEIIETLNNAELHPIGQSYGQVQTESIEKILLKNPMIKEAQCFKTPSGKIFLTVIERTPKYMIAGYECYYVDENRKLMPVSLNNAVYVPVVSGFVSRSMAKGQLFDFVSFVEKDTFWNAQIEQIYIREDQKVELVPRVGNAVILLGKLDNYSIKLAKLHRLYTEAFNKIGWDRYEKIDLQFENQIICSKPDNHLLQSEKVSTVKNDSIIKKL